MGVGTRALARRVAEQPQLGPFFGALNAMSEGRVVPVPGGVLIRDAGGAVIGAVGVSGDTSDKDEACALAGIERPRSSATPGSTSEGATSQARPKGAPVKSPPPMCYPVSPTSVAARSRPGRRPRPYPTGDRKSVGEDRVEISVLSA